LPSGKTVCNTFGFNPQTATKNPGSKTTLPQLNPTDPKYAFLQTMLGDQVAMLVLDEASMQHIYYLVHINDRMSQFPTKVENSIAPFGGHHAINLGDWDQIPAIGESIPSAIFKQILEPHKLFGPGNELIIKGCNLFKVFIF
jgi:hypothetical protein